MQPTEYQPDSYQLLSLKTWYQADDPRYLDPRHPLIKLAGEAGEILDLYGKEEYKPNFSWWGCKHCKTAYNHYNDGAIANRCVGLDTFYTPLVLDELGDWFYYIRILTWINNISFEDLYHKSSPSQLLIDAMDILGWLIELDKGSIKLLDEWYAHKTISNMHLSDCLYRFQCVLSKLGCTLDRLTELNYQKLNSEPTAHGWKEK